MNIAEAWLRESYQHREDEWNRTWADIFDPEDHTIDLEAISVDAPVLG